MKIKFRKIAGALRPLAAFTPSQMRGVLFLLPLLALFGVVIGMANRPRFETSFLELADSAAVNSDRDLGRKHGGLQGGSTITPELFPFDPNTVTLQELCRLGFAPRTAAGIIKYRERGKRFEIAEDFATCYGVSMQDYDRLEPYIRIGKRFRVKPHGSHDSATKGVAAGTGRAALVVFDPNTLDAAGFVSLGFSQKQADVIVRYRSSVGGFSSKEEFAKCYVVSEEMMACLTPYIVFNAAGIAEDSTAGGEGVPVSASAAVERPALVELNGADSAALRSVSGIGEVLVVRILEYRDRLGGFASPAQLGEVSGMTEENLRRVCQQIYADSCEIQKIDINFAPHKTLVEQIGKHPYATDVMLRKLLKNRQLKGGWRTIGEIVEQDILTDEEAERLSPYLLFRSE